MQPLCHQKADCVVKSVYQAVYRLVQHLVARWDDTPGDDSTPLQKAPHLIGIERQSSGIVVGIQIQDIHVRGQHQRPVCVATTMHALQTLDASKDLLHQGDDLLSV